MAASISSSVIKCWTVGTWEDVYKRQGISPVAADLHRIGGFDLLAGIQKGCAGVLLIGQQIATDFHTSKTVLRVRVRCQNLQIGFKALDKAFVLFNLLDVYKRQRRYSA